MIALAEWLLDITFLIGAFGTLLGLTTLVCLLCWFIYDNVINGV